ncbi:MAG TPA: MmgE/PrpD family protein [bacterium]|jgi:2-methylcitrate dehydratase PrpD
MRAPKPASVTPIGTRPAAKAAAAAPANIAQALAAFVHNLEFDAIPAAVRERAAYLMLDATGIALASTRWDFAHKSLSAVQGLAGSGGGRKCTVLGMPARLPLRDAVLLNGILVHGLDYDDTHVPGVIHATASAFPCALGVGEHLGLSGRAVLTAYVAGIETGARLGAVAKGAFHQIGFHPTGLIGAYACALLAGRLLGATPAQLHMAQGITLSTGAGSLEFLEDGSWSKRLHPGWAGVAGITGAALARQGFVGPQRPYEGRFGLFPSHLGPLAEGCDYALATAGLGETWELEQVAVKPFPICHFAHGCADAALALRREHGLRPEDIAEIRALVPREVIKTICEPAANKLRPVSDYDAKFSLPFIVAACLVRGRFGLAELEADALHDETILALAAKVRYEADPASPFPRAYSGELVLTTRDGRELRQREHINRGAAERPLANAEIEAKFLDNAQRAVSRERAGRIRDALLGLPDVADVREMAAVLGD